MHCSRCPLLLKRRASLVSQMTTVAASNWLASMRRSKAPQRTMLASIDNSACSEAGRVQAWTVSHMTTVAALNWLASMRRSKVPQRTMPASISSSRCSEARQHRPLLSVSNHPRNRAYPTQQHHHAQLLLHPWPVQKTGRAMGILANEQASQRLLVCMGIIERMVPMCGAITEASKESENK